jgi:HK97 family phage major capsid protein
MGRGLNAAYTTGAGTTTIQGVVTGATNASVASVDDVTISYANMLNLMGSVDPAYQANARFMFNFSTLTALRGLLDTTNRPLWEPNVQAGAVPTFLGMPYTINQDMASIGASAKSVLYGDFSNYLIREVAQDRLVILRERFADTDEIGIVLLTRRDGQLLDAGMHPIKYLVHAAS